MGGFTDKWDIERTLGSHQAVLKGVLEVLKPQTVVECGCGDFSTPVIRNRVEHLITIEHDKRWAKRVQKTCPPSPNHIWMVDTLGDIKNPTAADDVSPKLQKKIDDYYDKIAQGLDPFELLFVDTFRAVRNVAVNKLLFKADFLILHDINGSSYDFYQFEKIEEILKGWCRYEHRPDIKIEKHIVSWTALYSRKPLDLDLINPAVIVESERLWNQKIELEEIHA